MNSKTPGVLVVGSSNTDLVLTCERLPGPGETLMGGEFLQLPGGKGANQAVAAARAGVRVAFLGARGRDNLGKAAAAALKREKIDVETFYPVGGVSSGVALILIGGKSRENMIGVAKSANDRVGPKEILKAVGKFQKSKVVLAQLEIPLPAVQKAAELAVKFKQPFLLNPAPARPLPAALLRKVEVLLPNEHEAFLLTGEKDMAKAGQKLLARGCRNVVITRGAKGALWAGPEGIRKFPAPKVKPVDTVGAGDCFCGWVAAGLAEGISLVEAIQRALRAAALSVTRTGAQASMPLRKELL